MELALRYLRQDSVQVLFDWENKIKLGAGAFAKVCRVTCKLTRSDPEYKGLASGQVYAIKVIAKASLRSPKQLRRVAHEVAILRSLNSEYCVKLYDAFQDAEYAYLVEECVRGGELFEVITGKGSLSEQEAVEITLQLVNALVYLHDLAIVYRDLKAKAPLLMLVCGPSPILEIFPRTASLLTADAWLAVARALARAVVRQLLRARQVA